MSSSSSSSSSGEEEEAEEAEEAEKEKKEEKDTPTFLSQKMPKSKAGKDPNKLNYQKKHKIKSGHSAFMWYSKERRGLIKEAEPSLHFGEIAKKIGLEWGSLNDKKKVKFEKLAYEDKARYEEEMKGYMPPEGGVAAKKKKRKKKKKKRKKDPNAPKRSKSAYMFFGQERRPQLVEANPKWTFGEFSRKMGEEWRGMSDKKKGKYNNEAAADKARYEEEMKGYTPPEGGK